MYSLFANPLKRKGGKRRKAKSRKANPRRRRHPDMRLSLFRRNPRSYANPPKKGGAKRGAAKKRSSAKRSAPSHVTKCKRIARRNVNLIRKAHMLQLERDRVDAAWNAGSCAPIDLEKAAELEMAARRASPGAVANPRRRRKARKGRKHARRNPFAVLANPRHRRRKARKGRKHARRNPFSVFANPKRKAAKPRRRRGGKRSGHKRMYALPSRKRRSTKRARRNPVLANPSSKLGAKVASLGQHVRDLGHRVTKVESAVKHNKQAILKRLNDAIKHPQLPARNYR